MAPSWRIQSIVIGRHGSRSLKKLITCTYRDRGRGRAGEVGREREDRGQTGKEWMANWKGMDVQTLNKIFNLKFDVPD